ncbi:MAG: hypothetical protein O2800_07930 [Planctomycetota bacterium]|nr:hypothetical protein [Planctomycetota bacterium]
MNDIINFDQTTMPNPVFTGLSESASALRMAIISTLVDPPVFGLASMVGSSPQTSILAAEALRPTHLLLLSTEGVGTSVATIREWFDAADRGWVSPSITVAVCDPIDPNSMSSALADWRRSLSLASPASAASAASPTTSMSPRRLVLDATGGKKSMSVAAGMIAMAQLLEVVYIDSQFDPATRRPRVGSERLVRIPHVTIE